MLMLPQKKKLIVIGAVAIAVVCALGFQLRATLSTPHANEGSVLLADEGGNEVGNIYLKLFREYKDSNLILDRDRSSSKSSFVVERNPFIVPAARRPKRRTRLAAGRASKRTVVPKVRLKLGGILWDEDAPSAVINNKVVQVSDRIGSYRVVKIFQDRVIVSNNKKRMTLKLPKKKSTSR